VHRLQQAVLAAALAAASITAQALNTATAELTAIRVQVVDLTPDDGIAAALILPSAPAGYYVVERTFGLNLTTGALLFLDDQSGFYPHTSLPFSDSRLFSGNPLVNSTVERGADRLFAGATALVGNMAASTASWSSALATSTTPGDATLTGALHLGPGTALVLSADYQVSTRFEAGAAGDVSSWLSLFGAVGTVAADQISRDMQSLVSSAPGLRSANGSLSLTLSNASDQAVPVYFGANADASSMVTAVPEPSSLAMLLGGGLVLGLRARAGRRR
jgi:hypothetical protein